MVKEKGKAEEGCMPHLAGLSGLKKVGMRAENGVLQAMKEICVMT
jgi:hypothetical protein